MFHTNKMLLYILCAFSVAVFEFGIAEKLTLPPIITCKQNSANFDDCLKDAIQEAWPLFVKGLPEFDMPPLDPVFVEEGKIILDRGAIHGEVTLSNISALGLANVRFMSVKSNLHNDVFRLEIDVRIPKIFGEADFFANSTLSTFRLGSKGYFNATLEDVSGSWIITGPVANDTWTVENFYAAPSIKKMKFSSDDLFNGNKVLSDLAIDFVNEYWPQLYRTALPIMVDLWGPWLANICNLFFSKVSFSEIFG